MNSYNWLKNFVANAFHFQAPIIKRLESTDFIIEDKMLFILSWEFTGSYKLMIPQLKKTYKSRNGSVVIKIPPDTDFIRYKVSTWWRTSHYTSYLTKIKLDSFTAKRLIQELEPVKELNLSIKPICPHLYVDAVVLSCPVYKGHNPIVNLKITLKNNKLIYPAK